MRGFLRLASYYCKFIQHYGSIKAPLNRLLGKDGFEWTPAATVTFQHLKDALTRAPVLRLPDFIQRFVVECDACEHKIGAVLMQQR